MPTEPKEKWRSASRRAGFASWRASAQWISSNLALNLRNPALCLHHEIVHNTYVVEQHSPACAIFVESIDGEWRACAFLFSARTASSAGREGPKQRSLKVIECHCPSFTQSPLKR